MTVVAVIPARIDSQRLYGKMLLAESGSPLIWYAWNAANQAQEVDRVLIATDSERIKDTAEGFGAEVIETGRHACGSDRCADAVEQIGGADIVINLQGDEPEIQPQHLDILARTMRERPEADMATLMTRFNNWGDVLRKDNVKVVTASDGSALYFSRSAVPHTKSIGASDVKDSPCRLHIGVYAFRGDYLNTYRSLPETPVSASEELEQLRALCGNARIVCVEVDSSAVGIDTREDYLKFVLRIGEDGSSPVHKE